MQPSHVVYIYYILYYMSTIICSWLIIVNANPINILQQTSSSSSFFKGKGKDGDVLARRKKVFDTESRSCSTNIRMYDTKRWNSDHSNKQHQPSSWKRIPRQCCKQPGARSYWCTGVIKNVYKHYICIIPM